MTSYETTAEKSQQNRISVKTERQSQLEEVSLLKNEGKKKVQRLINFQLRNLSAFESGEFNHSTDEKT